MEKPWAKNFQRKFFAHGYSATLQRGIIKSPKEQFFRQNIPIGETAILQQLYRYSK